MSFIGRLFAPGANQEPRPLRLSTRTDEPRNLIIGRAATAGAFVFHGLSDSNGRPTRTDNEFLHQVIVLAGHRCQGVARVWADGELVRSSLVHGQRTEIPAYRDGRRARLWLTFYDGRPGQAADPFMLNAVIRPQRWRSTDRLDGCAYITVTAQFDDDSLTSPPEFIFEVDGARLYDRRRDSTAGGDGEQRYSNPATWVFTSNPAVVSDHYQLGIVGGASNSEIIFGMGLPAWQVPFGEFQANADLCDEQVESLSGFQSRYAANGVLSADVDHRDNITRLARAMAAQPFDIGGRVVIRPTQARPITLTLTDADLVAGENYDLEPTPSGTDLVNLVRGTYREPTDRHNQLPYPQVQDDAQISADGRIFEHTLDLDLETNSDRAQRLALIELEFQKRRDRLSEVFMPLANVLEVGDWFTRETTLRGAVTKTYEVTNKTTRADLTVEIEARETDPSVSAFALDDLRAVELPEPIDPINTVRPAIPDGQADPAERSGGGAVLPSIVLTVTPAAGETFASVDYFEVEYGISNGSAESLAIADGQAQLLRFEKQGDIGANQFEILGVLPKIVYAWRVRAVRNGRAGDFSQFVEVVTSETFIATQAFAPAPGGALAQTLDQIEAAAAASAAATEAALNAATDAIEQAQTDAATAQENANQAISDAQAAAQAAGTAQTVANGAAQAVSTLTSTVGESLAEFATDINLLATEGASQASQLEAIRLTQSASAAGVFYNFAEFPFSTRPEWVAVNGTVFDSAEGAIFRTATAAVDPGGTVDAHRLTIPAEIATKFSGRPVIVRIVAKVFEGQNPATMRASYSTSELGNSGFVSFVVTDVFTEFTINYNVPRGTSLGTDFLGIETQVGRNIIIQSVSIELNDAGVSAQEAQVLVSDLTTLVLSNEQASIARDNLLTTSLGEAEGLISETQDLLSTEISARVSQGNLLSAQLGEAEGLILANQTAISDGLTAQAERSDIIQSTVNLNSGLILTNQVTISDGLSSLAEDIRVTQAGLGAISGQLKGSNIFAFTGRFNAPSGTAPDLGSQWEVFDDASAGPVLSIVAASANVVSVSPKNHQSCDADDEIRVSLRYRFDNMVTFGGGNRVIAVECVFLLSTGAFVRVRSDPNFNDLPTAYQVIESVITAPANAVSYKPIISLGGTNGLAGTGRFYLDWLGDSRTRASDVGQRAQVAQLSEAVFEPDGSLARFAVDVNVPEARANLRLTARDANGNSVAVASLTVQNDNGDEFGFVVDSTTGRATILGDLDVSGTSIRIGAARIPLLPGAFSASAADGEVVNFGFEYPFPPRVTGVGGPSHDGNVTARAVNVTKTSFTASVKIVMGGTITTRAGTVDSAGTGGAPTRVMNNFAPAGESAADDRYLFTFSGTVQVTAEPVDFNGQTSIVYAGTIQARTFFHNGAAWIEGPVTSLNFDQLGVTPTHQSGTQTYSFSGVRISTTYADDLRASGQTFGLSVDSGGTVSDLARVEFEGRTMTSATTAPGAANFTVRI